jgi:hypothetical protein
MKDIADIAGSFLHALWYKGEESARGLNACVGVLGFCPDEQTPLAFLLETDHATDPPAVRVRQVVESPGTPIYFGFGRAAAESLAASNPLQSPLTIIRRVIKERLEPTVGGHVQYGRVVDEDFRVFPVMDHDVDHGRKYICTVLSSAGWRSIPMYHSLLSDSPDCRRHCPKGYVLTSDIVDPFGMEREALYQQGYRAVPRQVFDE